MARHRPLGESALPLILLLSAVNHRGCWAAPTLEENIAALEAKKIPIHYEVLRVPADQVDVAAYARRLNIISRASSHNNNWKVLQQLGRDEYEMAASARTNGHKHLLLYHREQGHPEMGAHLVAGLLPLGIEDFQRHGMATDGDTLEVDFQQSTYAELVVLVHHPATQQLPTKFLLPIRDYGGIGYVRLTKDDKDTTEERLYYVRVPIHLFNRLDGETISELQPVEKLKIERYYHHKSQLGQDYVVFRSHGDASGTMLASPLRTFMINGQPMAYITSKELGVVDGITLHLFTERPDFKSHTANLQYVVITELLPPEHFNRLEPKTVEKYGRLMAIEKAKDPYFNEIDDSKVEFVFQDQYGHESREQFPLVACEVFDCYCHKAYTGSARNEMGVTYTYKLDGPSDQN